MRRRAPGRKTPHAAQPPAGFTQTFGEMEPAAKDGMSHRAVAFAKLKAALFG
jgi:XTP/dITP diphosphohydrolase